MSHNPNTVKSQHELSTDNDGKRSSEVLLSAIDELEKTKKERDRYYKALSLIDYKTSDIHKGKAADIKDVLWRIKSICDWTLRPDEMIEMHKVEFEKIKEFYK